MSYIHEYVITMNSKNIYKTTTKRNIDNLVGAISESKYLTVNNDIVINCKNIESIKEMNK